MSMLVSFQELEELGFHIDEFPVRNETEGYLIDLLRRIRDEDICTEAPLEFRSILSLAEIDFSNYENLTSDFKRAEKSHGHQRTIDTWQNIVLEPLSISIGVIAEQIDSGLPPYVMTGNDFERADHTHTHFAQYLAYRESIYVNTFNTINPTCGWIRDLYLNSNERAAFADLVLDHDVFDPRRDALRTNIFNAYIDNRIGGLPFRDTGLPQQNEHKDEIPKSLKKNAKKSSSKMEAEIAHLKNELNLLKRQLSERASNNTFSHPATDPKGEHYPPELHTAILAWEAIYLRNEKQNPYQRHSQAIETWLEKNSVNLPISRLPNANSTALKDRIGSITTPEARKPRK